MAEAGSQWYLGQRWALFARDTWDDCQSWVAACVKHAMLKSITCFKGVYVMWTKFGWNTAFSEEALQEASPVGPWCNQAYNNIATFALRMKSSAQSQE